LNHKADIPERVLLTPAVLLQIMSDSGTSDVNETTQKCL